MASEEIDEKLFESYYSEVNYFKFLKALAIQFFLKSTF